MVKPAVLAILVAALSACSAPPGPKISAEDGWSRETGQAGTAAAYLTIQNKGGADHLTGVRASIGEAMLHESSMEDGVARMRPIDPGTGVVVPSNGKLVLAPGGIHVMITRLEKPLTAGDRFTLTLQFAKARPEKVEVAVLPAADAGGSHQ